MKCAGRVIVYGEYLMHAEVEGLVVPTASHCLASEDEASVQAHPEYDRTQDGVARVLESLGFSLRLGIRGNLPLGYGLGSSSALAVVHLKQNGFETDRRIVNNSDAAMHGFSPSGVDAECALRQRPGMFCHGKWRDVALEVIPELALMLLPKERELTLSDIRARVLARARVLGQLAVALNEATVADRRVPYPLLFDYCAALSTCGAYSSAATALVGRLLDDGVAAKCTGGLYDKAIVAFWPDGVRPVVDLTHGGSARVIGS